VFNSFQTGIKGVIICVNTGCCQQWHSPVKIPNKMLSHNPERLYLRFNIEIVFSTAGVGRRAQRVSWISDVNTCNKYFSQHNVHLSRAMLHVSAIKISIVTPELRDTQRRLTY